MKPRMIDIDGILLSTNDMYSSYGKPSNIKIHEDDIEFTEEDANDVIDFICNSGFDILIFSAYKGD